MGSIGVTMMRMSAAFLVVLVMPSVLSLQQQQHTPVHRVGLSGGGGYPRFSNGGNRLMLSFPLSAAATTTAASVPSSITNTKTPTGNNNTHTHTQNMNVPYVEAHYDPQAANVFYKARPMKSLRRFVQIASQSSRFVLATTLFDKKKKEDSTDDNASTDDSESTTSTMTATTTMTKLEQQRSQQLVSLLTALGPAFIKVGQALSTRTDLLPNDQAYYALGLSTLQDSVSPSFTFDEATQIIEAELQLSSIHEIFASLSEEPVASASIGQVYKGVLKSNGMVVAVKVQRPKVLETVALDLYVMRSILVPLWKKLSANRKKKKKGKKNRYGTSDTDNSLNTKMNIIQNNDNDNDNDNSNNNNSDTNTSSNGNTDSIALIDAWGTGFVNELDYRAEARATTEFTQQMTARGLDTVVFAPEVVDELCSTHVLTTKWIDGERLSLSNAEDVPRLCSVALNAYLVMLLETGTLHCDPHPGNLLRTPEGKLCILDWGMVINVPTDLQLSLLEFITNLNAKNYEEVPNDLVKLQFVPPNKLVELRQSGLTVGIGQMLNLAAQGGGPKGAMQRMVAENKEKYRDAIQTQLGPEVDFDSKEATQLRQQLFQSDWRQSMAEDSLSRDIDSNNDDKDVDGSSTVTATTSTTTTATEMMTATTSPPAASTTIDLTTKIESLRQQNTDVFAIPDYFVYMSRAFATLEGIGLSSNANYSILQECYPYLAKRLLCDDSPRARNALRTLLYGTSNNSNNNNSSHTGNNNNNRRHEILDLTKFQELSEGLQSYTTSTSSVDSGSSSSTSGTRTSSSTGTSSSTNDSTNDNNTEGRDAALAQVANVVLSEDPNYVQEVVLRETAVALDATVRDVLTRTILFNPFSLSSSSLSSTILRPTTTTGSGEGGGGEGGVAVTRTTITTNEKETAPSPVTLFLRPFTLPLDFVKASLELQSLDNIDEKRLENVRILTQLIRPTTRTRTTTSASTKRGDEGAEERKTTTTNADSSTHNNSNNSKKGALMGGSTTTMETIGKLAREASQRRFALARIGVRFTGTLASVQAERLRDRAAFMQSVINSSTGINTNTSTSTSTSSTKNKSNSNQNHLGERNVAELAEVLASNGAMRLEALAEAIQSFDEELANNRRNKEKGTK